jgi:hypothetical protein
LARPASDKRMGAAGCEADATSIADIGFGFERRG